MRKSIFVPFALLCLTLASCANQGNGGQVVVDGLSISIFGPTSVEIGQTARLNVTLTGDTERLGYTISSSDNGILTVTSDGIVTGINEGSAIITAATVKNPDIFSTYTIDVIASTSPVLSINVDQTSITMGSGVSVTYEANLYNPTIYTPRYEWSSKFGRGTFIGNGTESINYRPFYCGSEVVELTAYVGPYVLKAEKNLFIKENIYGWTPISTKQEAVDYLFSPIGAPANYYLTADIDMEGYEHFTDPKNSNKLTKVLDGRGHKITNIKLGGGVSNGALVKVNNGLFNGISPSGALRNIEFDVELTEGASGWGSGAITNGCDGVMDNVLLKVNHSFDNSKNATETGYVEFCGGLAGIFAGTSKITNCVVDVEDNEGKATIYADCPYPSGGKAEGDKQGFLVKGIYTNTTVIGGQLWDWGGPVKDQSGYVPGLDWSDVKATTFSTLSSDAWVVVDNEMPQLAIIK